MFKKVWRQKPFKEYFVVPDLIKTNGKCCPINFDAQNCTYPICPEPVCAAKSKQQQNTFQ